MQIFVDADACPVVAIIEKIAKDNSVPVMLLCDTNHVLSSTYSKVVVVGAGADAVDCCFTGLWCCCNGIGKRCLCYSSIR